MVLKNEGILALTRDILACRKCRRDPSTFHYEKTVLGKPWIPPTGWAGEPEGHADLLLVALNPGSPLPGEREQYAEFGLAEEDETVTEEQAQAVTRLCLRQYQTPKRSRNWIFHRKSVALARALLWLKDGIDPGTTLWSRCWFTDLFKCSTRKESNPTLTRLALLACRPYLEREIQCTKPILVVALGNRAYRGLTELRVENLVKFRHPSNGCPRLDAEYHDSVFDAAAGKFKVQVPPDFRKVRRHLVEESFR